MRCTQGLAAVLLAALAGSGLAGCGGFFVPQNSSGGNTNTGDYLYVANTNNTYLAGFGVSSSGTLSVLKNSPYNNGIAAQSLAVTPANSFLYAGTNNGIYAYKIAGDGSIAVQNGGAAVAQDMVATSMQVDSTGGYLLAAGISTSLGAQAIAIYQINASTGLLTALTGSPIALYTGAAATPTVVAPSTMLITPNNSYVYVSLGSLGVQVLTLGSSGALSTGNGVTILAPVKTSTTPSDYGLASDPKSAFLFVSEINTGLRVFSIGTGGSLNEVSGSPYSVGTGPAGITLDSSGTYVYVVNKGSNNISGFSLAADSGKLTVIAGSPFNSGGQLPIAIVSDNSKKFMAVINSGANGSSGNNDLQVFKFDTTVEGKLTAVSNATTGTDPTNPGAVAASH